MRNNQVQKPASLFPSDEALGLLTDFYELTMSAGYWSLQHNPQATFEAFVRILPENRQYLIAAGLEQAIHYLLNLRFTGDEIDYLRGVTVFDNVNPGFWDYLAGFRFRGDLWAVPEGTVVFANEPMVRAGGTLLECQLIETCLLTSLNIQTLVATKASRVCTAAQGRSVVDFGARRAHGPQAGLLAARASYIGGCVGASNVLAAKWLNIPPIGTQAHSWIMSFDNEQQSFEAYAKVFPKDTICLIDTYNTTEGAHRAIKVGKLLRGVRLDSGNLVKLSKQVRKILDQAGLTETKIVASSDLNEYTIRELLAGGAEIDIFGVGTDMVTSKDAPALSVVYKLVEIDDGHGHLRSVCKSSTDKVTIGGAKQTFRRRDREGKFCGDTIGLADEKLEGEPLMAKAMASGELTDELPDLEAIRRRARGQISALPAHLLDLRGSADYPVEYSEKLRIQRDIAGGGSDDGKKEI